MRIKGMVCRRCIATVKDVFMEQGFRVQGIRLGEVIYEGEGNDEKAGERISQRLQEEGFEVLTDKQTTLLNQIKELAEQYVRDRKHHSRSFASVVTDTLPVGYDTVSALFSAAEGITLEQYLIGRRVEQVKEYLQQKDLSLSGIAFRLGYSSVHHLSNQFKKVTGLTPSSYREALT